MYDETETHTKHNHDHDEEQEMKEEHVNVFAGGYGHGNCGFGGYGGCGGYGYGAPASGVELVDTAVDIETLTKLGDIQGQIGISAAQIQNSLLEQTIANQQGFNSVNAGIYAVNSSVKDAAYAVSTSISNDGDKTRALIQANYNAEQAAKFADLERQLGVAQATNANTVQLAYVKNEIVNDVKCLLASACFNHSNGNGNGNGPKS